MKQRAVKCISVLLAALLLCMSAFAADTGAYLKKTVPNPQVGSVGGEWAVIGLKQSGAASQSYCDAYIKTATDYVKSNGAILDSRKSTENARVVLALTLVGKDARNIAGFDLTKLFSDFTATTKQGLNGAIWALIALDSAAYPCSQRQNYVNEIVARQLPDGGWNLSKTQTASDLDLSAMALQALALYKSQPKVKSAIEKGTAYLKKQTAFSSSESAAQTVIAFAALGEDCTKPLAALETFALPDGSYRHTAEGDSNQMATEQAYLAKTAASRKTSLYLPDAPFRDLLFHPDRKAVEALAAKGVLTGRGDGIFDPDSTVTRAEFSAMLARELKLPQKTVGVFSDVAKTAWYAPFVGAAYAGGCVSGRGNGKFDPNGTITRQETALILSRVLTARGVKLQSKTVPASDAGKVSDWARDGVALCYQAGVTNEKTFEPLRAITRAEVARMLYNGLEK